MYTGIIEGLGLILFIKEFKNQMIMRIRPLFKVEDYCKGESIAVNGVCLSVVSFSHDWFEAYVSEETFNKSNLKKLKQNCLVNFERALKVNSRFGGHFVAGHVDGLATIKNIKSAGASNIFTINYDPQFSNLLVEKGSIALDGMSLTVNSCDVGSFEINVIPETFDKTNIANWRVGYQPNIEFDLIGKHVEQQTKQLCRTKITKSFLIENGFK